MVFLQGCIIIDDCMRERSLHESKNVAPCTTPRETDQHSSSSTDDETEPKVKKKRVTRRPRRNTACLTRDEDIENKSSIYSNRVNECYEKLHCGLQKTLVEPSTSGMIVGYIELHAIMICRLEAPGRHNFLTNR